jgi:carbamate kinase
LLEAGVIVICTGGGGIPALRQTHGSLMGVEAVVDKNVSSALLATSFGADALLLLTDVDAVYCDFGTDAARAIPIVTPDEARHLDAPAESMAPKLLAADGFVASKRFAAVWAIAGRRSIARRRCRNANYPLTSMSAVGATQQGSKGLQSS